MKMNDNNKWIAAKNMPVRKKDAKAEAKEKS